MATITAPAHRRRVGAASASRRLFLYLALLGAVFGVTLAVGQAVGPVLLATATVVEDAGHEEAPAMTDQAASCAAEMPEDRP